MPLLIIINIVGAAALIAGLSVSIYWGIVAGALYGAAFIWATARFQRKQAGIRQMLFDGLLNIQDNNLGFSLTSPTHPEDKALVDLFNNVVARLRKERQHIHQRELMLDKVVNQSNVLTVLVSPAGQVVYANDPALDFFSPEHDLVGRDWQSVLNATVPAFLQSLQTQANAICSFEDTDKRAQSWQVSRSQLNLHGAPHGLYLFKPMTDALNKKEIETWKKAIRVISHELNNSIAPISSLCHSGEIIAERAGVDQLDRVFAGISRRIQHLSEFVTSYGKLARIGEPDSRDFNLQHVLNNLRTLYPFHLRSEDIPLTLHADETQVEQALINLIKNASEASPEKVEVSVSLQQQDVVICIDDAGPGIPDEIMHQVMLPFYTTKTGGSGIGLSICRHVAESHNGSLTLQNRPEGGLRATLRLPVHSNQDIR